MKKNSVKKGILLNNPLSKVGFSMLATMGALVAAVYITSSKGNYENQDLTSGSYTSTEYSHAQCIGDTGESYYPNSISNSMENTQVVNSKSDNISESELNCIKDRISDPAL